MKLAVITDSSAYLSDESRGHDNLFVLDIQLSLMEHSCRKSDSRRVLSKDGSFFELRNQPTLSIAELEEPYRN